MDLLAQYDSDDSDNVSDHNNEEIQHNFNFKKHDNKKDISLDLNASNASNSSLFDSLPMPSSALSSSLHQNDQKNDKKKKKKKKHKKRKKRKRKELIMNETKIENKNENESNHKDEPISLIDILPEPKYKKRKIEETNLEKKESKPIEIKNTSSSINNLKTVNENDKIINISQRDDLLKRDKNEIKRTFEIDDIVREEIKIVPTNTYNRITGEIESVSKYTKTQKKKHQINTLAYEAQEKALQLAMRRSASYKTKAETQAKYGW